MASASPIIPMCALYVYTNVSFAPNIFMKWKPTKGKMIICETMKYGRAMNFNIVSSLLHNAQQFNTVVAIGACVYKIFKAQRISTKERVNGG